MKTKIIGISLITISILLTIALILNLNFIFNSVNHNIDSVLKIPSLGFQAGHSVGYFIGYNFKLLIGLLFILGIFAFGIKILKQSQIQNNN